MELKHKCTTHSVCSNRIGFSYQLLSVSPWPLTTALSVFTVLLSIVLTMNSSRESTINETIKTILLISLIFLAISIYCWFNEIIEEATFKGEHTIKVVKNLNLGFILFVISEIAIFFTLFFAYFYNSLIPSIEIGSVFPPTGIITLNYKAVPLLNTAILFLSGIAITASHNYLLANNKFYALLFLFFTILLGSIFTYFQYFEYNNSLFSITDSIFGAGFFILTGCHGLHIIIGTAFLIIALLRFGQFSLNHHLNFNFSAIYWHFVDVVWLFLFAFLYCWSSN